MSGQFSATVMFVSIMAIALAANRAEDSGSLQPKAERGPASVAVMKKEEILQASMRKAPTLLHTEKLHGPLFVTLEMVGAKPVVVGDVFILRGTITSHKPLNGADFTWSLPAGVELVNGEVSGHLEFVSADQPGRMEITLRKTGATNAQVHLQAVASTGSTHFGDTAQYNTELQETLDAKKEQMKKSTAAEAAKRGASEVKVFH